MHSTLILLNALYDAGNKFGHAMAWVTCLLLAIAVFFAMGKYVFSKEKE